MRHNDIEGGRKMIVLIMASIVLTILIAEFKITRKCDMAFLGYMIGALVGFTLGRKGRR